MYASIFGADAPKIVINYGLPNEVTVLIDHWVPDEIEPEPKKLILESEFECERDIIYRGEFIQYSGKIYLWKYQNPLAKFNEIYQYRYNKDIVLWEHRDAEPFKDETGNPARFALDQIRRSYLRTLVYRDVMHLTFISLKAVNHGANTQTVVQANEIIMDGGTII